MTSTDELPRALRDTRGLRIVGLAPASTAALATLVVVVGLLRHEPAWMRAGLWLLMAVPLARNLIVVTMMSGRSRLLALLSSAMWLLVVVATLSMSSMPAISRVP